MKLLTMQEIFDKVAVHLLTQNAKSTVLADDDRSACLYHGYDGLCCAIGCLIPPEVETEYFNSFPINGIPNHVRELMGVDLSQASVYRLLESLQRIHDQHEVYYWRVRLAELADRLTLSADVLNTVPMEETT